jgi:transposase
LEDNLRDIWESGLEFMQDNAPIHSAQKVQDWLRNHEIPVMTWPPYSPDLNPIENA